MDALRRERAVVPEGEPGVVLVHGARLGERLRADAEHVDGQDRDAGLEQRRDFGRRPGLAFGALQAVRVDPEHGGGVVEVRGHVADGGDRVAGAGPAEGGRVALVAVADGAGRVADGHASGDRDHRAEHRPQRPGDDLRFRRGRQCGELRVGRLRHRFAQRLGPEFALRPGVRGVVDFQLGDGQRYVGRFDDRAGGVEQVLAEPAVHELARRLAVVVRELHPGFGGNVFLGVVHLVQLPQLGQTFGHDLPRPVVGPGHGDRLGCD